jgi:SAM-dependent methyltransferase
MRISNYGDIENSSLPSVGFDPRYFSQLAALEEQNFWFLSRNRLILWAMRKWANVNDRFLEIGCGTGFALQAISKHFPGMAQTGSDLFPEALEFARRRVPGAQFMSCDAKTMSFQSEFDCIGAFDVLEHIDDDETAVKNLFEALCPGGLLLITVPQHSWLWSQSDEVAFHCRRYDFGQLEKTLTEAGFDIVRSTSFMFLLLPIMSLSRLKPRSVKKDFDAFSELRLPVAISRIFESILQLEIGAIRAGINLPIGGSRLIVARKPGRIVQNGKSVPADG